MLALQRLEAAFGAAFAFDLPRCERLGEPLDVQRAEVVELEQAADQPPRRLADHHAAGRRQCLQPRRQVRRVAHHRLFARRALADQIPDH